MAETDKDPTPPDKSEDDQRAAAAAVNRKRTLEDWEDKKKRWRSMGVPPALPAAGSPKAKK
ncbi:MAG: hypothetical protein H7X85_09510 [Thermoanaerobaculia bacterium]|nr:hypothetical protein [Thermoanaerobaculia bacterium]